MRAWRHLSWLVLALAGLSGPLAAARQPAAPVAERCVLPPDQHDADPLAEVASHAATAPPVFKALGPGRLDLLDRALKAGVDPNACFMGISALSLSARMGDEAQVRRLLAAGAQVDKPLGAEGGSALFSALGAGRYAVARTLLQMGANARLRDGAGMTTLHQLALAGVPGDTAGIDDQVDVARRLASLGVPVDARGPQGSSALLLATAARNTVLVGWLLSKGADPDQANQRGESARTLAQRKGHDVLLRMFDRAQLTRPLRQGRSADFVQQLAGCGTPGHPVNAAVATELLMSVLSFRMADAARALLACGADANERVQVDAGGSPQRITPLVYAAGDLGSLPLVQALLDAGADPSAPSQRLDGTPLTLPMDAARKAGYEDIARVLAARAAKPGR